MPELLQQANYITPLVGVGGVYNIRMLLPGLRDAIRSQQEFNAIGLMREAK